MLWVLVAVALAATLVAVFQIRWRLFSERIHPWMKRNATLLGAYRSLLAFVGFPVVIAGGLYTYVQVLDRLERPDVALELVHPKSTAVLVKNVSKTVVRDPMYHVALFNVDADDPLDPLPIPVNGGSYVRVGERWGPNAMLSIPNVKRRLEDKDRLLGWAWVTCPTCPKRFYWVYIEHGIGGWIAEMKPDEYPNMAGIQKLLRSPESAVAVYHRHVPEEQRVPIE